MSLWGSLGQSRVWLLQCGQTVCLLPQHWVGRPKITFFYITLIEETIKIIM